MKKTVFRMLVVLFLVASLATMGMAPGTSRVSRTLFSGTEFMGAVIDPGTMTQADGKLLIRGLVELAQDVTSEARVSGDTTLEINANFEAATFSGPMWGKAHLKNGGGEWEVVWVGRRTPEGQSHIWAWGVGKGGYHGLVASWEYTRLNPDIMAPMDITGFILDKEH